MEKQSKGITLIALVITIIVLLILAGVSIATLSGDNGVLTKASDAKTVNVIGAAKDEITLKAQEALSDYYGTVYVSNETSQYSNRKLVETIMKKLQDEFDGKTYADYTIAVSGTEAGDTITIQSKANPDLGTVGTIDENGKITWEDAFNHNARIVVTGLIVKNGETEVARNSKSVAYNTALKVDFDTSIIGGTIDSVTPALPYETTGKELSKNFTITGKDKNGNTITKEYTVNLKGYYNIPELKVGDFVTYNLTEPTTNALKELNDDIAAYSGASDNVEKTKESTLLCRVLEVNSIGEPTRLISANGVNSLSLYGADGYNNAVYLINKMCTTLYSGNKGTTTSLTIEDLEKRYFDSTALASAKGNTYGQTTYYTGNNAKYPNIAKEEAGMGIATTLVNGKNEIRNGGLGLSQQTTTYTGSGDANASSVEEGNKGITVPKKIYNIREGNSNYKNEILNNIIHKSPTEDGEDDVATYWLASRYTNIYSSYGSFGVYYVTYGLAGTGVVLFRSSGVSRERSSAVRPVINLNSGIQAEYAGEYNGEYNSWTLK